MNEGSLKTPQIHAIAALMNEEKLLKQQVSAESASGWDCLVHQLACKLVDEEWVDEDS
ncbi:MAG: hypothetical protein ACKO7W_22690 [Elainella sp.]